jgi:hypothetical protein
VFLDLESNAFLLIAYVFVYNNLYYVGSEMSDILLENIIESSILLKKEYIDNFLSSKLIINIWDCKADF